MLDLDAIYRVHFIQKIFWGFIPVLEPMCEKY